MRTFLRESAGIYRHSNLIFVCGGNDETHLRQIFREYVKSNNANYKIIFPEFAVKSPLNAAAAQDIDLSEFERLMASLSLCVVLFPEGPGSYAELGLFSAWKDVAEKVLVIADASKQGRDSFMLSGPIRKIDSLSTFRPTIWLDYDSPNLSMIIQRINERRNAHVYQKHLNREDYSDFSEFEQLAIILWIIDTIRLVDLTTIVFLVRSLIGNSNQNFIESVLAVLIGSKELFVSDQRNLIGVSEEYAPIILPNPKEDNKYIELKQEIITFYMRKHPEFYGFLAEAYS